jgi:hypothetical protein
MFYYGFNKLYARLLVKTTLELTSFHHILRHPLNHPSHVTHPPLHTRDIPDSTISSFGYDFSHLGVQFQIRLVTGVVQSQLRQVYREVQSQLHQIYRVVQFHIRQYLTTLLQLLTFHRPKNRRNANFVDSYTFIKIN